MEGLIATEAQREVAGYLLMTPLLQKEQDVDLILDPARVARFQPGDCLERAVYDVAVTHGHLGYAAISDALVARGVNTEPLMELMGSAPAMLPLKSIQMIDEYYERRNIHATTARLNDMADDLGVPVDRTITYGQTCLAHVPIASRKDGITGREVIQQYRNPDPTLAMYPEIRYVDAGAALAYLRYVPMVEGSNNIIAAGPGEGKSVLAWSIARELAKGRAKVAILAYEMSRWDYHDWELAHLTGMPVERLRMGRTPARRPQRPFSEQEQELIDAAHERMEWMENIRFFDAPENSLAMDDAGAVVRRLRKQGEIDLLIIDHLHCALVSGGNSFEKASNASTFSMRIALDCAVPVIALAQLNRAGRTVMGKHDRAEADADITEYQLTDLADSGKLEANASSVCFLQQVYRNSAGQIKAFRGKNALGVQRLWMAGQIRKNRQAGGFCTDWGQEILRGRFAYEANGKGEM